MKLERDHIEILKDKDLTVLTFGTPYLGVENTDVLLLFCDNKQANDMRVLTNTLGDLGHEWTHRFNQAPGGRDTPQVPLYAFWGTEDRFIAKTSACGYPQTPCEAVDGDHVSIVKPTTRQHLAYQKLKLAISETHRKASSEMPNDQAGSNWCQHGRLLVNKAAIKGGVWSQIWYLCWPASALGGIS